MKILVREQEGWKSVEPVRFANEDALQTLLKLSPEIIPADPQGAALETVWCREFPTDAGPIDLLGIGSDGSLSIMECKLARNQEIRREVVGQVLDYASALWGLSVEDLEARFERLEGSNPFDRLDEALGDRDPDWEHGASRAALAETLREGSFRLLIAVDEQNSGLKRIIGYMNSRAGSDQRLKIVALTFPMYAQGNVEILVPESYGDEAPPAGSEASRSRASRSWTEDEFLQAMSGPEFAIALDLANGFIAWMREHDTGPTFGRGASGPLYVHIPLKDGGTVRPLTLGINGIGRLEVLFNELAKAAPFDGAAHRHALKDRLNAVPGISVADTTTERAKWTNFSVAPFAEATSRLILFDALDWMADVLADGSP